MEWKATFGDLEVAAKVPSTERITIACERDEAAFISVALVARRLLPWSMTSVSDWAVSSGTAVRFST